MTYGAALSAAALMGLPLSGCVSETSTSGGTLPLCIVSCHTSQTIVEGAGENFTPTVGSATVFTGGAPSKAVTLTEN